MKNYEFFQRKKKKKNTYTQVHCDQAAYTRRLDFTKARIRIHALSRKEKHVYVGKLTLGPWQLVLGIWTMVLDHGISTDVLIPSIGSMVLCYYGFGPWYCEGPMDIKGEEDH